MNTLEILRQFCATENEEREHLRHPMRHDGYLYATNGHIAVRVADDRAVDAAPVPELMLEKMLPAFAAIPGSLGVPIPELPEPEACIRCGGTGHLHRRECPECRGDGTFRHGRHDYECAECDGDGYLRFGAPAGEICPRCDGRGEEPYNATLVGDALIDPRYLRLLQTLPQPVLYPNGPKKPLMCRFDGGVALVMPMRRKQ